MGFGPCESGFTGLKNGLWSMMIVLWTLIMGLSILMTLCSRGKLLGSWCMPIVSKTYTVLGGGGGGGGGGGVVLLLLLMLLLLLLLNAKIHTSSTGPKNLSNLNLLRMAWCSNQDPVRNP